MKRTSFLVSAAATLAVAAPTALAQPAPYGPPPYPPAGPSGYGPSAYAPPPAPAPTGYYTKPQKDAGGFYQRQGLLLAGVGFGLGSMGNETGAIRCDNCDAAEVSFAGDVRLGGMLTSRFGLMLEAGFDSVVVEAHADGTKSFSQTALLAAAQYHLNPRFYLKGGLGISGLSFDYEDSYQSFSEELSTGTAFMVGGGYELVATRQLSLDLTARLMVGTYDDIDERISAGSIGLALNYY